MKYFKPIQKIEQRELSIKEYDPTTNYILYNFRIPQAIDINLDITPEEIEWLYKTNKTIKRKLRIRK